jgi:hypothetical protein
MATPKQPKPSAATPSGRLIRTLEGYRAFHPNPLPPDIEWTPRLVRVLSQADLLAGRLAGEGRRLQETPDLNLMAPATVRL